MLLCIYASVIIHIIIIIIIPSFYIAPFKTPKVAHVIAYICIPVDAYRHFLSHFEMLQTAFDMEYIWILSHEPEM